MGLTLAEHRELGATLKEARRLLLEAAAMSRGYPNLSRQFYDLADATMSPRAELERRLIALAGDEQWVREVYFGNLASEEIENA